MYPIKLYLTIITWVEKYNINETVYKLIVAEQ